MLGSCCATKGLGRAPGSSSAVPAAQASQRGSCSRAGDTLSPSPPSGQGVLVPSLSRWEQGAVDFLAEKRFSGCQQKSR